MLKNKYLSKKYKIDFYHYISEAICDKSTLPSWSGYEKTTLPNVILSGQTVGYKCSAAQTMIPVGHEAWDPESDGMIDVTCIDGTFEQPTAGTPPSCVDSSNIECNSRPEPPSSSGLEYQNVKSKYRPDENAYYVCKNNESIIQPNGTTLFSIPCETGVYNFNADLAAGDGWPECTVEPICVDLIEPPVESLMIKATKGDSVRLGDHVVYECAKKHLFWETKDQNVCE